MPIWDGEGGGFVGLGHIINAGILKDGLKLCDGDFAYNIASLVALNAASVRAIVVAKIIRALQKACPGETYARWRLSGR